MKQHGPGSGDRFHRVSLGRRVGPYELERLVGHGGFGGVYVARHVETGEYGAVKRALPGLVPRARMQRAIRVQSKLEHQNVMRLFMAASDSSWFSMPLAISTLEARGPFARRGWGKLRTALLHAATGLNNAHRLEIVHRNVRPANVLDLGDRWVVGDWGFVRGPEASLATTRQGFDTRGINAPEVFVDSRCATPAADVFSLGRLASWGTGLQREERGASDDEAARWWRELIDATTGYDPRGRWPMPRVLEHLRGAPQVVRPVSNEDLCPTCGSDAGFDQTTRCLVCHSMCPW